MNEPMMIISNSVGQSCIRGMETVEILIDSQLMPDGIMLEYAE